MSDSSPPTASTAPTERWGVICGDCREVLRAMADDSIDAVVTDPPYDLTSGKKGGSGPASLNVKSPAGRARIGTGGGFMGKSWDATGVAFDPETWREVLRVLKPGGHLLAFGGTRTSHRMVCAIEQAGFEVRDSIHWLYFSGFPKSLDVSKAIDSAAGAKREVVGVKPGHENFVGRQTHPLNEGWARPWAKDPEAVARYHAQTAPATEAAQQWSGWGTSLKPGHEPICLARKPLRGTVVANVCEWGTGAINVDGCRVAGGQGNGHWSGDDGSDATSRPGYDGGFTRGGTRKPDGRWPPNVLLTHAADCRRLGVKEIKGNVCSNKSTSANRLWSEDGNWKERVISDHADANGREPVPVYACAPGCPVAELGRQSGERPSMSGGGNHRDGYGGGMFGGIDCSHTDRCDTGTAVRFFPCFEWGEDDWWPFRYVAKASRAERGKHNDHVTVKPLELMRWLVRLVTPPGGLVLDPFVGSGTTLVAACMEGFRGVGIELDPHHVEIARARCKHHAGGDWKTAARADTNDAEEATADDCQLELF